MPEERAALDPATFDALAAPRPGDRRLWGAKEIAAVGGVSEQTVRRSWAADPAIPVQKRGARYYALRSELLGWLRAP